MSCVTVFLTFEELAACFPQELCVQILTLGLLCRLWSCRLCSAEGLAAWAQVLPAMESPISGLSGAFPLSAARIFPSWMSQAAEEAGLSCDNVSGAVVLFCSLVLGHSLGAHGPGPGR